jgi:hypothetical protein
VPRALQALAHQAVRHRGQASPLDELRANGATFTGVVLGGRATSVPFRAVHTGPERTITDNAKRARPAPFPTSAGDDPAGPVLGAGGRWGRAGAARGRSPAVNTGQPRYLDPQVSGGLAGLARAAGGAEVPLQRRGQGLAWLPFRLRTPHRLLVSSPRHSISGARQVTPAETGLPPRNRPPSGH